MCFYNRDSVNGPAYVRKESSPPARVRSAAQRRLHMKAFVDVTRFAADVRFIDLDFASSRVVVRLPLQLQDELVAPIGLCCETTARADGFAPTCRPGAA
jgi:hypothetical protein